MTGQLIVLDDGPRPYAVRFTGGIVRQLFAQRVATTIIARGPVLLKSTVLVKVKERPDLYPPFLASVTFCKRADHRKREYLVALRCIRENGCGGIASLCAEAFDVET